VDPDGRAARRAEGDLDTASPGAEMLPMTEEMLRVVLETANAKVDQDDWSAMPEGRHLTLHAAHDGVGLTAGKLVAIRVVQGVVRARNLKGETFMIALADLFAATLDGGAESASGRKAGFFG
jgi:hypothetical protein